MYVYCIKCKVDWFSFVYSAWWHEFATFNVQDDGIWYCFLSFYEDIGGKTKSRNSETFNPASFSVPVLLLLFLFTAAAAVIWFRRYVWYSSGILRQGKSRLLRRCSRILSFISEFQVQLSPAWSLLRYSVGRSKTIIIIFFIDNNFIYIKYIYMQIRYQQGKS